MAITKICIIGLDDYAMLTRDISYGHIGGESVQYVLLARAWRDLGLGVLLVVHDHGQPPVTTVDGIRAIAAYRGHWRAAQSAECVTPASSVERSISSVREL